MRLDDEIVWNYRKSREAVRDFDTRQAVYWYTKNRKEHGVDLYYEVELPAHLLLVHPLGTVLGRATYGDYLVAYHNVTVGSSIDHEYPSLGTGVVLFSGARVIGPVTIGNNVWVSPNTVVTRCSVPNNSVVYPAMNRQGCDWKPTTRDVIERFFPPPEELKAGAA